MDVNISVIGQKMRCRTNLKQFAPRSQKFVRFYFDLDEDWDSLTTFAQFRQGDNAYNDYLDSKNSVYLPPEITGGCCTVMLYGTGSSKIATTNYLTLTMTKDLFVADADSTEISQSLYDQLVDKVNTLSGLSSDELTELIEETAQAEIQAYIESGALTAMTIEDGSIPRSKVDEDFESTLALADGAMQTSVYDTTGKKTDVYAYADSLVSDVQDDVDSLKSQVSTNTTNISSLQSAVSTLQSSSGSSSGDTTALQSEVDDIKSEVEDIKNEVEDARTVNSTTYSSLGEALRAVYTLSISYTDESLADFNSLDTEIVTSLPTTGEENVLYLMLNDNGDGYDIYLYVTDSEGNSMWTSFGGTGSGSGSTEVVTELPTEGDESIDYILQTDNGYLYYKYINGEWHTIGGSTAYIGESLPTTGDEYTDYYIGTADTSYIHYRYIDGAFYVVGGDSYSKDEIDEQISTLNSTISSNYNALSGNISTLEAEIDSFGNMVSDVTEGTGSITVYYADGSSKEVATSETSVMVEDVNKSDTGIQIVYSDGETKDIEISGGGGTSTSGSVTITRVTDASTQCVYGDECLIEYTLLAVDSSGDYVGDGTATWYVNSVKKATSTAYNNATNSFDISSYLSVGSNTVKVSVSIDTGGDTNTTATKSWTVNAVNMYAIWDYDDTTINESDTVTLRWTPYGDLSKTSHFVIDGDTENELTSTTTRSGVQQYLTMDKLSHGSHMVELYLTATVNNTEIQSASIYHDMIFVDSDDTTPIISVSLGTYEMTQYNTLQIPVVIYTPGSLTSNATLAVDGEEVAEWSSIDRTIHYWNYTPSIAGTKVLTITSGVTTKTITLTVEELDIDVEEVTGYVYRMKSSDIASNEALQVYTSNNIALEFSDNFDWNNGGIQTETDDDGNTRQYVCIKAGTTMTVDYELFGDDARVNGKSFKVIFKVVNSRDYDAVWLECLANSIGISLGANEGTITSEQNTINVPYAEDSYIELEFDVRKASEFRYIQTFIDGVLSSTVVYATDDNFTQTNKQYITIGSADCDVYIYMIKAYESSLSLDNHMDNFIADAPNAQEMVSRYDRNDVLLDAGTTGALTSISYTKLATQDPDLRIHLWDIPRMTEGKKDYVYDCSYQQIWTNGDQRHQITAEGVRMSIQGTSSVNYKDSGANTDGSFLSGFTDGNGDHIDTYSMTDDSIGVDYMNTKVNIASCENVNNMCLAEWYNTYNPYQTLWRQNNSQGRDCMELHLGVQFIKDQSYGLFDDDEYHMYAICCMGNSKKNLTVFHDADNPLECCIEVLDNNSNYCLMVPNYDDDGNEVPFDVDQLDSEDFFEFRYPDDPTDDMKNAWVDFVTWMTESNPALATDEALGEEVTFDAYTFKGHGNGGTEVLAGTTISTYAGTYTTDSYEYRMAKMLNECEDHLIIDSLTFHYCFVEEHAMVDNVCKNTFWGTEDLQHWNLCKNYDNDKEKSSSVVVKLLLIYGRNSEMNDALQSYIQFNFIFPLIFKNLIFDFDSIKR